LIYVVDVEWPSLPCEMWLFVTTYYLMMPCQHLKPGTPTCFWESGRHHKAQPYRFVNACMVQWHLVGVTLCWQ